MSLYGRYKRAVKRGLKAGGFYTTRVKKTPVYSIKNTVPKIKEPKIEEKSEETYEDNEKFNYKPILIILIIIILINLFLSLYNPTLKYINIKKFKKEISTIFKDNNVKDYYIEYKDENKKYCIYDLYIVSNIFDDIDPKVQYMIINNIKYLHMNDYPYCAINSVTISSKSNEYTTIVNGLYKNEKLIYKASN